jgi:hypothetical protein
VAEEETATIKCFVFVCGKNSENKSGVIFSSQLEYSNLKQVNKLLLLLLNTHGSCLLLQRFAIVSSIQFVQLPTIEEIHQIKPGLARNFSQQRVVDQVSVQSLFLLLPDLQPILRSVSKLFFVFVFVFVFSFSKKEEP